MDQTKQIPQEIRSYLEGLIADSGLLVEEDTKEGVLQELYARLDNFLASAILENIPEEEHDNFIDQSGQKKSMEEMQNYLMEKIPNAKEVLTKAFVEFRNLYLGNVAVKRESENLKSEG